MSGGFQWDAPSLLLSHLGFDQLLLSASKIGRLPLVPEDTVQRGKGQDDFKHHNSHDIGNKPSMISGKGCRENWPYTVIVI